VAAIYKEQEGQPIVGYSRYKDTGHGKLTSLAERARSNSCSGMNKHLSFVLWWLEGSGFPPPRGPDTNVASDEEMSRCEEHLNGGMIYKRHSYDAKRARDGEFAVITDRLLNMVGYYGKIAIKIYR
jgi:hypothetical protein